MKNKLLRAALILGMWIRHGGLRTGLGVGYEYSRSANPTRTAGKVPPISTVGPPSTSAVRITCTLAGNPEMSKLARRRKRAPIGGYCVPVRLEA